jgi:nitrilase
MLVDPWGGICAELAEGEGVVTGEIDLGSMMGIRASLPALQHRTL